MRKSFYHILLLGALTLGTTSSCDDYLEVDHYDILPEDFMYRNEANIKSGLYGIYDTFYTYQGSDNSGDDTTWGFKPNYLLPDTVRWIARRPAGMPNGNVMRY